MRRDGDTIASPACRFCRRLEIRVAIVQLQKRPVHGLRVQIVQRLQVTTVADQWGTTSAWGDYAGSVRTSGRLLDNEAQAMPAANQKAAIDPTLAAVLRVRSCLFASNLSIAQ